MLWVMGGSFIMFILGILWFVCGLVNAAALNAMAKVDSSQSLVDCERYRKQDLGTALIFGMLSGVLGFPFVCCLTGFYQDGFSLSSKPLQPSKESP